MIIFQEYRIFQLLRGHNRSDTLFAHKDILFKFELLKWKTWIQVCPIELGEGVKKFRHVEGVQKVFAACKGGGRSKKFDAENFQLPSPPHQSISEHSLINLKTGLQTSGVATGVARGADCHPWQPKFAKNREKRGNIGKKRQKSGSFFHFAPPDR